MLGNPIFTMLHLGARNVTRLPASDLAPYL